MAFQDLLWVPLFFFFFFLIFIINFLWVLTYHGYQVFIAWGVLSFGWMWLIRDLRVFNSYLLPVADLEISKRRVCAWTAYSRKDIGNGSFFLFWLTIKHKLFFLVIFIQSMTLLFFFLYATFFFLSGLNYYVWFFLFFFFRHYTKTFFL